MKFKRFTALLMAIIIIVTLQISVNAETTGNHVGNCGSNGNNVTYSFDENSGVLTISGNGDMEEYVSSDKTPWNTYKTLITSLVVKNGVTSVGRSAFSGTTKLTSAKLDASVTKIGENAFYNCVELTNIEMPGAESISSNAFYNCVKLTSIELPQSVTSLGAFAFYGCSGLTSIEIPANVASIADTTFFHCSSLRKINVDKQNETFSSIDGVLYSKDKTSLLCFPANRDETVVSIPYGVLRIGYGAFNKCTKITQIEIPSSTISFDGGAFTGCSSLSQIIVDEKNGNYCSVEGVVYDKQKEVMVCFPPNRSETDITILSGVKSIGYAAFYGCKNLTQVIIPKSVTNISSYAFYDCSALKDVEIPSGVTKIGDTAFANCTSITSISLPLGIDEIGQYVFSGCTKLVDVEIPSNVKKIGNYAFFNCTGLINVDLPSEVTRIGDSAFRGCKKLQTINVPQSVTYIGEYAFSNCVALTGISIPSSITEIFKYTFFNCQSLPEITLPEGLLNIAEYAFYECSNITDLKIPSSVQSIGSNCFERCYKLTSIEIPANVQTISNSAFMDCREMKTLTIESGVKNINASAFWGCRSLTRVDIPASVTAIGNDAFNYCSYLNSLYVFGKNTKFGTNVLGNTSSNLIIYGYNESAAQKYASDNSHTFVNAILKIESPESIQDKKFVYSDKSSVFAKDLEVNDVDKNVFIGYYDKKETVSENAISYPFPLEEVGATNNLYSNWIGIGTLEEEADDELGANVTTSGFELYGAQFRTETISWSAGLRFCTRVSKSLLSEIEEKTGNPVECGYVLCIKDSVPSESSLKVGMTTKNGKTVTEFAAPKKYYDGNGYFVYTAVVLNIPDNLKSVDIVARPFIKYTDANGVLRYYYFTENGNSNCGGGYYTNYQAVIDAHLSAMGN